MCESFPACLLVLRDRRARSCLQPKVVPHKHVCGLKDSLRRVKAADLGQHADSQDRYARSAIRAHDLWRSIAGYPRARPV